MKINLVKDNFGKLVPADADAVQALKKYQAGEYLSADVVRPRNLKHHRRFWALITVVFENLPEHLEALYPTTERLVWELKRQTGYFEAMVTEDGTSYIVPKSISFASMDDAEFDKFFGEAIRVCIKVFLPQVSNIEIRTAVNEELARWSA